MKAGMRILHVLDHGLPLQSGYTFRTRAILKAEEAKGWTVAAVTGPRHGAAPAARESVDGLDFFRTVPPPKPMSPNGELREIGAFAGRIGEDRKGAVSGNNGSVGGVSGGGGHMNKYKSK